MQITTRSALAGISLGLFSLILSGCSSEQKTVDLRLHYVTTDSAPGPVADKNAQSALAEAAVSVDHSLQQLSAIQIATHPGVKAPHSVDAAAIGMADQASLDWVGPVEPLLNQIAQKAHYRTRIVGHKPAIPVLVTLHAHNEMLADLLLDVTLQVQEKATIILYPQAHIIEMRYK
ncbi:MAG: hypothetical protein A3J38_02425 [Gammaproteobacteria bacterium RIFCSPHIGHO2_12_FULL_45_9]|nr:MAG: hypothetical protein A3J38_02425 [Gammaproteobacteria bacterium RIFCSPHIGHO2_12_FULL_45_9]